jgi:hypothetical protein
MTEHLNNHHRETVRKILGHPASSNVTWREVVSLLNAVAVTTEDHNGKLTVTLGGETETVEPPRGKDVEVDMVVDLRRMLTRAGYSSET